MAVVIDEAFFSSLVGLEREKHLSNAEIAWFVVGYEPAPSSALSDLVSHATVQKNRGNPFGSPHRN